MTPTQIQQIKQHIQQEIDRGRVTPGGKSWSDFKIVDNPEGNGFTLVKYKNL